MNKVLIIAAIALARSAWAGVTVVHDPSTNTFWPFGPSIETVTNPAGQTVVGESFNNSAVGNSNIAQTFIVNATNQGLQSIAIYAIGGTGTGTGTNLTLNLYDLGFQSPPNPSVYSDFAAMSNLLGGGAGLSVNYSPRVQPGLVDFIFTEFVPLQFGHMYAFELAGTPGTAPVYWMRTGSGNGNAFAGGTAYRDRTWLSATADSDFALAVHSYSVGATNPPPPLPPATSNAIIDLSVNLGPSAAVTDGGGVRIGPVGSFIQNTLVQFTLVGPNNPNPIPLEFACIADQGYCTPPPSHLVLIQASDWNQVGMGGFYEKSVTFNYLATPSKPTLSFSLQGVTLFGQVNYTYEVDQSADLVNWTPVLSLPAGMITMSSPSALIPGTAPMQNGFLFYRAKLVACP